MDMVMIMYTDPLYLMTGCNYAQFESECVAMPTELLQFCSIIHDPVCGWESVFQRVI